ncbi:hypothetical protein EQG63_06255 [Flavobacterium amnicola]|uniref:Uncharacterized protein n=1 Tax=Flavobacterium amnicola TaxID=2506422 RepID=A0A4Q1K294_9FLAO|nr:hypothetical protein [Flavobacterium amnicola]RXR19045.1 hypothetical protein EQG63_06255 [Flavobacterium amnicola]
MKNFDLHNDTKIPTGFKIPENYFDSLEERVMQRISFDENKIATGFKVPDQYFDSLEEKVMQKLPLETKEVKVISLWQRKSVWISSIAAVFLISLGTLYFFNQQDSTDLTISSDYLAYQSDITTEDIALQLTDEDITALESELTTFDSETETYINDYLN